MALKIYNSLSRCKEEFKPLVERKVGIYVCGPTVYGHSHIGHAKSYVSFDVVVRYLRFLGYKVLYVQNITDVGHLTDDADEGEDKIEKQSRVERVHPMQIAEMYTHSYFEDMDALGVVRPDISPRATGHIIEQIEIIKKLIEKNFAYEVNGSVYFSVQSFKEYGKLSGRSIEEMEAGARIKVNPEKRHPADFALWKRAEQNHIMQWNSPWGMGYPGWHIECTAMSIKYLGETFDIHGGGIENQFPHHECEVAQSECAFGKPCVRYWMHNNMVTVNGRKMGKSLGNVITLKDAFKKCHPLVIRFFILQSHYRSTLDFTDEALESAAKGFEKLLNTLRNVRIEINNLQRQNTESIGSGFIDLDGFKELFLSAMDDDFNTPQAIAVLFNLSKEVNIILAEKKADLKLLKEVESFYSSFAGTVLGIMPQQLEAKIADGENYQEQLIQFIVELRSEARQRKLWEMADKIRDFLCKFGIVLEDKKDCTDWHLRQ